MQSSLAEAFVGRAQLDRQREVQEAQVPLVTVCATELKSSAAKPRQAASRLAAARFLRASERSQLEAELADTQQAIRVVDLSQIRFVLEVL